MRKMLFVSSICAAMFFVSSCGNNNSKTDTHIHEDGSTHSDHDTTKPVQQEFNVTDSIKKDTTTHKHDDGSTHSHK